MLPMKELQNYEEYQRSSIDSHENVDPIDYFADVDNHENVDPNDYVAENPYPSELPSCSSSTSLILTTKHSSPNISASSKFAISSSPDIFATDNNKSSPENSSTSNLEMLTSLAAQLANASADGSIPSQGLQFEEVDLTRYTSEPAYIEEVDLERYTSEPAYIEEVDLERYTSEPAYIEEVDLERYTSEPAYIEEVDLERYTSEPAYIEEVDLTRYTSKPAYVQSDVNPSYRDEMFDPLELEPCNEDVEMVDATTTEEGRVYVEPRANSVHSVSCGEAAEEINAQHQRKIKGENTKKKGRKQKKNLKSDQPAKLPPLPAESELFDDSDPEPEMQRRKKKSLTVLAEKMLSMFPMVEMDSVIQLDETAESLGADLRRLYTIVDVFEALHIMSRVGMNLYKWHGSNYLIQTLVWLREIAVCMGVPEQYELVKDNELEAILKSAEYKISEEARLDSPLPPTEPPAPLPSAAAVSPEYNCKYSGSTSVGINTQLFLMLMLVAPHPKTLNLQFAAKVLHGSSKHNPQRRFLDIANILSSLGLIQKVKVTSGQGLRNAYQYSGPCIENMEITESIKKSMPSSSQKNSLLPYPKPSQNVNNKKEVLKNGERKKRGRKVGSKKRVENCMRLKKDPNKKVGVHDDKRKKRRGRKLGQKNAKKVKVEVIIDEILDSVINEIETPMIAKKKRGRKLGSKKKVLAKCKRTDINEEEIVQDENSKKKIGGKPRRKNDKADVEIIAEILSTIINQIVETPKIVKKKRGRKPGQKNAKVKTETGIVGILDTAANANFDTPKILKTKQGRKVGYRNVNNNHKTEGEVNKNQIEMSMDLSKNSNKKKRDREAVLKKGEMFSNNEDVKDINSDKANRNENNVLKGVQKMEGRALSERVVNDKKEVKVNTKKPRKRKIDQKAEETKSKVKRVQELVQKREGKGMIKRAVNGEQILEINNKESNKKKIAQKKEETKSKGKRVREFGLRRSSRILEEKKRRDDLNVWESTGEKKVEKERETEKEELLNYLKLAACHTSV